MLHALLAEQRFPRLPFDNFRTYLTTQHAGESRCEIVRTHPAWTLKLDDAHTAPRLLKQFGSNAAYVRGGDHRHRLVERLQVTGNDAIVACRRNIPRGVLHEPARAQERH